MAGEIKIPPDGLAAAIEDIFDAFSEEVMEATERAVDKTGTKVLKTVRERSPDRGKGTYKKGWKKKKNRTGSRARNVSLTIYNSKYGSITHVVENGHQKVNGGRVEGIPHISVAEEEAQRLLPENLQKELEGIGK